MSMMKVSDESYIPELELHASLPSTHTGSGEQEEYVQDVYPSIPQ